jgi:hypothetical protein
MNLDDEKSFIMKFGLKHVRNRIAEMLEKETLKKRGKLRLLLPHSAIFDPKWIHNIPKKRQHPDEIYELLKGRNAPSVCHIISAIRRLDGCEMPLKEALDQIVGDPTHGGTIIICIPDHLGYFEGEEYGDKYIICDG